MDLHEALAKITRHPLFVEWHKNNPTSFLAHAFVMLDEANKNTWQIGFYNPDTHKMVTFVLEPGSVKRTDEQEILEGKTPISKLDVEHVKLSVEDALEKARECFDENYGAQSAIKHFFIIQELEGKAVFNITYLLQSFKTVNVKIDAASGEVIKHSIAALADFG